MRAPASDSQPHDTLGRLPALGVTSIAHVALLLPRTWEDLRDTRARIADLSPGQVAVVNATVAQFPRVALGGIPRVTGFATSMA